jgi:UDP-N-acetylglucosamine:LPS N-acetylglucosamine transferase
MQPSTQTKHFLILTADAGFGHRSAAKSVAAAIKEEFTDKAITRVIDPVIERPSPLILRKSQTDYDHTVLNYQDLYRFTYEISDSRTASTFVEGALTMLLHKNLTQLLDEFHPDAILSTHHMYNAPMGAILRSRQLDTPFFTVITDLSDVHSLWFQSSPDRFFVASEPVKQQALQCEIPEEKITVSGIPVDPALAHPKTDRAFEREVLGLDPTLPTLLFVGSPRVSGIYECLEALERCNSPMQVLVAAGGNNDLFNAIKDRTWNFPIRFENYVQKLSNWMNCADILVTKAGGLIVSEGLAAGLPILLIDSLPGQEDGNVRYVVENGAGLRIQNEIELLTIVNYWLGQNQTALTECAKNSRKIGHPNSAIDIANSLWQASLTGIPHRWPPIPQPIRRMRAHEQQHLD